MKTKLTAIIFIVFLLFTIAAADEGINLFIDGEPIVLDGYPLVSVNNTVMVSVRELLSECGKQSRVFYNPGDKSVSITIDGGFNFFCPGSAFCVINNEMSPLDEKVFLYDDHTLYVPIKTAAKILGYTYVQNKNNAQLVQLTQGIEGDCGSSPQ